MDLFEKVSKDIVAAMKAKDKVRLEALRNIKKYFIEAKTQPGANDTLTDEAALKILSKLANKAATPQPSTFRRTAKTLLPKRLHKLQSSRNTCPRHSRPRRSRPRSRPSLPK